MALTPKTTDKFSFGILYVVIACISLWTGFRLIDHGMEVRFFKDYLLQWEVGLRAYGSEQGRWPAFSGNNHVDYMDALVIQMRHAGISLPKSNTTSAYRYRMDRFNADDEDIFLLCFHDRIILFGVSDQTLVRLEKTIDGNSNIHGGRISGQPGKNSQSYIGIWQL